MKKKRIVLVILILAICLFILSLLGFVNPIKNVFWKVTTPFSIFFENTFGGAGDFLKNITHLQSILNQNKNLIKENLELQTRIVESDELRYENEILKKELGFYQQEKEKKLIPIEIIAQSPSGYLKSFIVSGGKRNGLDVGSAVVSQGFLVGTITQVRESNADLTLITDFNSLIPIILQDSRSTGLLRGGLTGLIVEDIPLNTEIKSGQTVLTSGLGGQIPSGIPVGQTRNIVSKKGEIFQRVAIDSPVDFSKLKFLFAFK